MNSSINITQANDLDKYSKKDYIDAIKYLNSSPEEIKILSNNVRWLIVWVKKFLKSKELDLSEEENPWKKLLESLNNSNNLTEIWIWKKISDILSLNNQEKDYKKLAFYDYEIWLPNKVKLKYDIEQNEWNQVVVLLKIVWFEELNKTYWYEWWSEILKEIVEEVKSYFEDQWFKLYRESGVTFWLVKEVEEDFDSKDLIPYIEEHIENLSITTEDFWTISIKTKVWLDIWEKEQLNNAIVALSNSDEKSQITEYTKALRERLEEESIEKNKWINEVESAINEWRLVPFFQWIRDNRVGRITKYEALVRIKQWERSVSPFFFLKHVEWTPLMKEVTKTMIVKTIEKMKESINSFSVNLTEDNLGDNKILELISNTLIENWIEASRLTIEVLEDSKWDDEVFYESIEKMKKIWVKIAIDDFWTGYSWFERIYKAKPDYLKIDGSLIKWITTDERKKQMVDAISYFAHVMECEVIAEYIENKEVQETLEDMWVEYSQWYLFSKPDEKIEI